MAHGTWPRTRQASRLKVAVQRRQRLPPSFSKACVHRFTPPLLDRLFDDAVSSNVDQMLRGMNVEQIKSCVARDIEALLNTRVGLRPDSMAGLALARASILSYGIHDFVGLSLGNPADREKICQSIRDAVRQHEPRLQNVAVALVANAGSTQFLNFSVTAMLVLDLAVEAVSFDALLQPVTQQYSVALSRGAQALQTVTQHE